MAKTTKKPAAKRSPPRKVSTPDGWRQKAKTDAKGWLEKLPSGAVVRMKKIALMDLITAGVIPNELVKSTLAAMTEPMNMTADQWIEWFRSMQIIAAQAVIDPKIILVADDLTDPKTQIYVGDIEDNDLNSIVEKAGDERRAAAAKLSKFRKK